MAKKSSVSVSVSEGILYFESEDAIIDSDDGSNDDLIVVGLKSTNPQSPTLTPQPLAENEVIDLCTPEENAFDCRAQNMASSPSNIASLGTILNHSPAYQHTQSTKTPMINPYASRKSRSSHKKMAAVLVSSLQSSSEMKRNIVVASPSLHMSTGYIKKSSLGSRKRLNPYRKRARYETNFHNHQYQTEVKREKRENVSDSDILIPDSFNSFDTFFAILLRSSVGDFLRASEDENESMTLWKTLCDRAKLPVLYRQIEPIYTDPVAHFIFRASLVLEEARETLSRSLSERVCKEHRRQQASVEHENNISIEVILKVVCEREHNVSMISFDGIQKFSKEELGYLRQGMIFECVHSGTTNSSENSVLLGCVLPCEKERIIKKASFDVLMFRPLPPFVMKYSKWTLHPVENFLPLWRQFSAVTDQHPEQVCFIRALQGMPTLETPTKTEIIDLTLSPTEDHVDIVGSLPSKALNFDDLTPEKELSFVKKESISCDFDFAEVTSNNLLKMLNNNLPPLNDTQELAMNSFINSAPATITIVQGPPGTGKTTMLVNTICRYLMKVMDKQIENTSSTNSRILVCAPTNKAITVLASRFLKSTENTPFNTVLVGEADKLLGSDQSTSRLRPYFAYTFHEFVAEQLLDLLKHVQQRGKMQKKYVDLKDSIMRSLKLLPVDFKEKLNSLDTLFTEDNVHDNVIEKYVKNVHHQFVNFRPDAVLVDLLDSADVIFCTLCSSGSSAVKKTKSVGALIIDEAAAATEPEICIPFHLQPKRLLIVGDPKQLPSTVLSDRARMLGLSTSLHERLMYYCGSKYVMLDTQYRMHPEICSFPSSRFYKDRIQNDKTVLSDKYQTRGKLLDGRPYLFLCTSGTEENDYGGSLHNRAEAEAIRDLILNLTVPNDSKWSSPEHLRIITFYRAQVKLIQKVLKKHKMESITVSTVDSSQGCESDIVILSMVRTQSAGFLTDDRRMNVALTRARYQLICVGSIENFVHMTNAPSLRHLASDAMQRNVIVSVE